MIGAFLSANGIGRALATIDLRLFGALFVGLVLAYVFRQSKRGALVVDDLVLDVLKMVTAVLALFTALKILAVFLLTDPPALELIGHKELMLVGLVTGVIGLVSPVVLLTRMFRPQSSGLTRLFVVLSGVECTIELLAQVVQRRQRHDGSIGELRHPREAAIPVFDRRQS